MVKIVKITPIKRKGDIRQIIDDAGKDYIIALESIMKNKIEINKIFSDSEWIDIIKESDFMIGLNFAYASLARGRFTVNQMRQKLSKRDLSQWAIDKVINRLIELEYLDDNKYTEDYVESYSKTCGKIRIKSDLLRKGIDRQIIDEHLEIIDNEQEIAYQLAKKFNKDACLDKKQRERIIRHLINKGFDYNTVLNIIRQLGANQDDIYDI